MIPTNGSRCVAPGNIGTERSFVVVEVKNIPPEIATDKESVLFRKSMIEFGIKVIEIITRTVKTTVLADKTGDQRIDVGSSAREYER